MKTTHTSTLVSDSVRVQEIIPGVIDIHKTGYISRAAAQLALHHAQELIAASPATDTILWDFTRHTGNDPGNLALTVRWMREHGAGIRNTLVVSSNTVIIGFVRVGRVLLPRQNFMVFAHREDALAELGAIVRRRRNASPR